ncbi:MAG: DUF87 domain-containing protein [Patescibacteria group bacterium]|nr:ATP-binding protein [Patescibacteria group bacterium]
MNKKSSIKETAKTFDKLSAGMLTVRDIIAPSAIEVDFNFIKVGEKYFRTLFVSGYPRFVGANWLAPVINYDHSLEISMFYYPVEARGVLDDLRRKIAEMEATLNADTERGRIVDPGVTAALEDAKSLQEQLVKGIERFFQFSFYITIPADSLEELNSVTRKVEATLGSLMLISKMCTLQMEEAFQSTIPTCIDKLLITRNMDTTSVATTFPFTSSELTANEGILYGVNKHNGSLVIFDRFTLENANSVIFAKSGAGKSYFVKLEAMRSILFGTDIIVIDPEAEYEKLSKTLGGDYISFSVGSSAKINPFDLPPYEGGDEENQLGLKILTLHTLFKIMLGNMSATEEAILDRALMMTYKIKGITQDPQTHKNEPPILEDLYKVLLGMEETEAKSISERLERYVKGSLMGVFDQRSTVNIKSSFTAFSVRELEDILRPVAIYIILDFIWTRIKYNLKKRILVVDEAWYLMQNEDSASFLYSIAKRARKYYLGLTTITQDVGDFLKSGYGKTIVTNSSMQVLLKQHPASIDQLAEVFYLSEGEKRLLLSAGIGEGLFFAGNNHVAMQIIASEDEHKVITTDPKEIIKMREEEKGIADKMRGEPVPPVPQKPAVPVPLLSKAVQPPTYTPAQRPIPEVKRDFPKPTVLENKPSEGPKEPPHIPVPPVVSSIQ